MKMKKEYMILLGIIAVLLIYLLFGTGRSKMSYDVPKLKNLVQEDETIPPETRQKIKEIFIIVL